MNRGLVQRLPRDLYVAARARTVTMLGSTVALLLAVLGTAPAIRRAWLEN